mgnify:CR=1 FL=1
MNKTFQFLLSGIVLAALAIVASSDLDVDISDCGCTSVGLQVKNNGNIAPCDVEVVYQKHCVCTYYTLPDGITKVETDSSTIFTFHRDRSFEMQLETCDHAGGGPCDFQQVTLYAQ